MFTKRKLLLAVGLLVCGMPDVWSQCGDTLSTASHAKLYPQSYPPSYPGGEKALQKFIKKNLAYPSLLGQIEGEGECVMHFTVETDGTITNITATDCRVIHYNIDVFGRYTSEQQAVMLKDCAKSMAKEGFRIVRKMKKWHPAISNNVPQRLEYALPLRFSMNYVDD
ncbi:MAG: TonB-dependent receptor [Bacteroidaceae bacterium]|nr:TonB-dependent receptor [Bacteroidaceae bacterium]